MKSNLQKNQKAIADFRTGRYSNVEIAQRYNVTGATISCWLRKAGIPLCKRGRRRLYKPTAQHRAIIEAARRMPSSELVAKFGISRQRIHQIIRKWGVPHKSKAQLLPPRISGKSRRIGPEVRSRVVSFRLTETEANALAAKFGGPNATCCQAAHSLITAILHASGPTIVKDTITQAAAAAEFHEVE